MRCEYCKSWISEHEHRCGRCGRRLPVSSVQSIADVYPLNRTSGALATAAAPQPAPIEPPKTLQEPLRQASLFHEKPNLKVLPFQPSGGAPRSASASKTPSRRHPAASRKTDDQSCLDFLLPSADAPRTLKTSVAAVIYCDAPVANSKQRSIASALDCGLISAGFALFLAVFYFCGGELSWNRQMLPFFGAAFVLIALFYGAIWILASGDTAGKRWVRVRLTNFDGFAPDRSQRVLRFAATCLSFCAVGMGLFWALVDEERLTWHDHISNTFPTPQEADTNFFRHK